MPGASGINQMTRGLRINGRSTSIALAGVHTGQFEIALSSTKPSAANPVDVLAFEFCCSPYNGSDKARS